MSTLGPRQCHFSRDVKHKWQDIVIVTPGSNYFTNTAASSHGTEWPHVQCKICGITSYRCWNGIIAVERKSDAQ